MTGRLPTSRCLALRADFTDTQIITDGHIRTGVTGFAAVATSHRGEPLVALHTQAPRAAGGTTPPRPAPRASGPRRWACTRHASINCARLSQRAGGDLCAQWRSRDHIVGRLYRRVGWPGILACHGWLFTAAGRAAACGRQGAPPAASGVQPGTCSTQRQRHPCS